MTFTVLLTPSDPRFRDRLAENLRSIVRPDWVTEVTRCTYLFRVAAERVEEIRESLRKDISPWGACIVESEDEKE